MTQNRLVRPVQFLVFFSFLAFKSLFAQTPVLSVDFASGEHKASAAGLLVGTSANKPQTAMVKDVSPLLWRITDPDSVQRLRSSGASLQVVVSDPSCYPSLNWCGNKAPYADWNAYEERVRDVAMRAGNTAMFDIWNEPDNPQFWDGTEAQFFEAYLRAYRVIRQTLGNGVLIGGPSIAQSYNKRFIERFLKYCLANGCEVNFLSWHELNDTDDGVSSIADHVADARATILQNSMYAPLRISKVYVNEVIGPLHTRRPGGILGYLYQLEKGGVDGAVRACWADSKWANECYNDTLDGLLTPGASKPRSAWWTYQMYAAGTAGRVTASTSNFRVVPLASKDATSAQVLVGYFNQAANWYRVSAPTPVVVQLQGIASLPFVKWKSAVRVIMDRIPDTGEDPLDGPIRISDSTVGTNGNLTLQIPSLEAGDAVRITLLPAN